MNAKQRDVVFQRWRGEIGRESRDLASLEQTRRRAMIDSDVREDSTLQSMIRAEVQLRRSELEEKSRSAASSKDTQKSTGVQRSSVPEPIPAPPPEEVRASWNRLAQALSASLERGEEAECRDLLKKLRALQEQAPGVIPDDTIKEYKRRLEKLQVHIRQVTDEIAALTKKAVSASRDGNEPELAQSMRRLTAIHVTHPSLLDEPEVEAVRGDIARAAEERRQHQLTTKKLLERERTITAEIRTLAAAVRDFHQVACTDSEKGEAFRKAESTYLRTMRRVSSYDTEWFTGVVLELADLLAEWTVPPLGAKGQINRFLDSISAGLDQIRTQMRQIEHDQEGTGSGRLPGKDG